jgi:hypothetical protein
MQNERTDRRPLVLAAAFALAFAVLQLWHRELVHPSVENDFPAHAAHAAGWASVFTVNGFYPFGYAFLLRLVSLAAGDVFLGAKVLAVLAGAASLLVVHRLGARLHSPAAGWAAALGLALNWHFHETVLLVGTDQAASLGALLAALAGERALGETRPAPRTWLAAGALTGLAALLRHTSLVLVPAFALAVAWRAWRDRRDRRGRWDSEDGPPPRPGGRQSLPAVSLLWLAGALLAYAPQMALSWGQKGTPLYHEQAHNVWFGIHGNWDWSNWRPPDRPVTMGQILREEPRAFFTHWGNETLLGGFRYALMTTGSLPPSLARRAPRPLVVACRLLTLAALAVTLWAAVLTARSGRLRRLGGLLPRALAPSHLFALLAAAGWAAAVGMAYSTSRYLLTGWVLLFLYAVRLLRELGGGDEAGTGPATASVTAPASAAGALSGAVPVAAPGAVPGVAPGAEPAAGRLWRLLAAVWIAALLGNAAAAAAVTLGWTG